MSGSPSRNAVNPRRTTSWSSTTSTRIVWSRSSSILGPIRFRRHADSHECPRPRRACDRESRANLGCTAVHGVEAEMAGMSGGRLEARPVVADLQDHLALLNLDPNMRRARPGVLLHVRQCFAPDCE